MFKTLRAKLAVMLFGLLGVLGVLHTAWVVRTSRFYLQEVSQRLDRNLAKHLADANIVTARGLINKEAASETFQTLMLINRNIEVYLLDREGRIVAFSAPPGAVARQSVRMEPIHQFLSEAPLPIFGDDPRHPDRQRVFSVAEFRSTPSPPGAPGPAEGYLYVILVGEEYTSALHLLSSSQILRSSAWALAGSIGITLVASLLIVRFLTRRLSCLGQQMQTFRSGGFKEPPPSRRAAVDDGDEIDQLCSTFREMALRIVEQIKQLKDNDRRRRELIANVSHDLRTPLQSLQGYLETLLAKEQSLPAAERRRYLESAIKHTVGLGALISQLFELGKLESKEIRPALGPFSPSELCQDVAQRLELIARERRVHLRAELAPDVPSAVGDVELIDRVLMNLVENALRYTPEGGSVSLTCFAADSKVVMQVSDTGEGIPKDDLPHIFERHYRADSSAHRATDGAGLGLAIAQGILSLHASSLRVESGAREGTVFSFDLRQVEKTA